MSNWTRAREHVDQAVARLILIRTRYESATDLPPGIRTAAIQSLTAKISALRAVMLNPEAHPWCEHGIPA